MRKHKSGADLISEERNRQIDEEGYNPSHDDDHAHSELALAAVAYASPKTVLIAERSRRGVELTDPWPWSEGDDRRPFDDTEGEIIFFESIQNADRFHISPDERIRQLVKAGALIAAEIDRLQRAKESK